MKKKTTTAVKKKTTTARKKKASVAKKRISTAQKKTPVKVLNASTPKGEKKEIQKQNKDHAPEKIISKEGYATTGHVWDGIQEFNNPLPRWWVWVFIATVIFALGYVVYYPSVPGFNGTSQWSSNGILEKQLEERAELHKPFDDRINLLKPKEIVENPELLTYSVAAGKALFALHCSQCHGAAGQGSKGYPSFLDDEWIWGGQLDDIIYTITHGVRNEDDPSARNSAIMAAYGEEEILSRREIRDVVRYLKVLSEGYSENEISARGKVVYEDNCASCHGENGSGMHEFGAPALNNQIWLYGGKSKDLEETITYGRAGQMPAWGLKLTPTEIKKLAVYVHSLTGGEE